MSAQGESISNNQPIGVRIPPVVPLVEAPAGPAPAFDKILDAFDEGKLELFDPELTTAVQVGEEGETTYRTYTGVTTEEEIALWAARREQAVRNAGHRGTWEGRRDIRGRHLHLAHDFVEPEEVTVNPKDKGRYVGKCEPDTIALEEAGVVQPIVDTSVVRAEEADGPIDDDNDDHEWLEAELRKDEYQI